MGMVRRTYATAALLMLLGAVRPVCWCPCDRRCAQNGRLIYLNTSLLSRSVLLREKEMGIRFRNWAPGPPNIGFRPPNFSN